jgi:hypothetical protein
VPLVSKTIEKEQKVREGKEKHYFFLPEAKEKIFFVEATRALPARSSG